MRRNFAQSFPWRLSHANVAFTLCGTYPQVLAMPAAQSDDDLFLVSKFRTCICVYVRSGQRLPAMTWGSRDNGATMWRSSQPKAGVSGVCVQDECLLELIASSVVRKGTAITAPILRIVDCRPRSSAMANKATGAGYESTSNYPYCKLDFYNIGNIHVMRDSLKSITSLLMAPSPAGGDVSFGKAFEDTGWLTHVRLVIKASYDSATFLHRGEPVLVHCSHGWDRTAQVCALGQVFIDPFYRTMEGFKVLVEKDWFSFGHAFGMRCAHGQDKATRQEDQVTPIFLQFLDCMWQLIRQYPQYFEFNSRYILTLADHIYSGRFGTFLFSSDAEREELNARRTPDVWTYLHCNRNKFINRLYSAEEAGGVFLPPLSRLLRNVTPWSDYFYRWASAPSLLAPTLELQQQLYRDGYCTDPTEGIAACSNGADLEVPAVVSHDGWWEAQCIKEKRIASFAQKQVSALEALLRKAGVGEEDIAGCLSGAAIDDLHGSVGAKAKADADAGAGADADADADAGAGADADADAGADVSPPLPPVSTAEAVAVVAVGEAGAETEEEPRAKSTALADCGLDI
eukprot:GSChrysophyteH2.ASY1.ANO1.764.1 assembled CDS